MSDLISLTTEYVKEYMTILGVCTDDNHGNQLLLNLEYMLKNWAPLIDLSRYAETT